MFSIQELAKGFDAIGSEQRLLVYITLIKKLPHGLNVKDLQIELDMKPSTLAHHIKFLVEVHLVKQERHGKEIFNFADDQTLSSLCTSILDMCCTDTTHS